MFEARRHGPECVDLPLDSPLALLLRDRARQLRLVHPRPAADLEVACSLEQLRLRRPQVVDAAERLAAAVACRVAALRGARIRWALALLGLPVVAHLLERVH